MIPRIPGLIPNIPQVALRVSTSAFFDRTAVQNALTELERKAFPKATMVIKDRAKRIIKRKGMGRLSAKVTDQYPGAALSQLVTMGVLTAKTRDTIIREVQTPPASPPGTPPFTHTPYSGLPQSWLGFRRNLWNFYDATTHSGVVGPSKKGRMIPYLHEFGGTLRLRTWVFIPQVKTKRGGMRRPITMKLPTGQRPNNQTHWRPMSLQTVAVYPARPFMLPAMRHCIANGSIAKAFRGNFRSTGSSGSGFTVRRA